MVLSMAQRTFWKAKQMHLCSVFSGATSNFAIVD